MNAFLIKFPQELAADAKTTPNVVEATNKPRLYDRLEDIQKRYIYVYLHIPII